jgi:PAS domain S-box-containing protein
MKRIYKKTKTSTIRKEADSFDREYAIQDLIDLEQLQRIFEKFTQSTGFTIGFLDHPGLNILIATGWRDICTKFHRAHDSSANNCKESNKHLLEQLEKPGQIIIEECDNGLVDCATPIIIQGKHIASLATGQLLLKKPDIKRFKRQARKWGFDENKYLEALQEIPVVSRKNLKMITSFLGEIATVISDMGFINLSLKEEAVLLDKEITERKQYSEKLKDTTIMLESILNAIPDVIGVQDPHHSIIRYNEAGYQFLQMSDDDVQGKKCYELIGRTAPCDICATSECYRTKKPARVEKYVEELQVWLDCRAYPILDEKGDIRLVIEHLRDITERKKMDKDLKQRERELKEHVKELEEFYDMAVGRELRMKQLKEENKELKEELEKLKK